MKNIQLDIQGTKNFITGDKLFSYEDKTTKHLSDILGKKGSNKKYLGWIDYPLNISDDAIAEIDDTARFFRSELDAIVVIGIGGSYLGAKMINEAMQPSLPQLVAKENPAILYAGCTLNEDYLAELITFLRDKKFGICVISKSGTTLEPAISFHILKNMLEKKVGKQKAAKYIIAITDRGKGVLRAIAEENGYKSFVIPDDIGGRYSVLTPVGLLPIALAGNDIRQLLKGATTQAEQQATENFDSNIACKYAAIRHILHEQGKFIEILVGYDPKLFYLGEWWKQLFAESEGKEGKGIFTAGSTFTTDLHSLGQYIQEGRKFLFETTIKIEKPKLRVIIPMEDATTELLANLGGKNLEYVNQIAAVATQKAHIDGGVPNLTLTLPELNEFYLGQLIYFFELSCALSGYLLGINPFTQPGVEEYKKNMRMLMRK